MDKRVPHHKLTGIKALVEAGQARATASAYRGALELGIEDMAGMCAVVMAVSAKDFHKSMTTHANNRISQDVYHPKSVAGAAVYLKLTVIDELLIVSFKEL
jgi:motility quorum-sensing regulator / GCU-specific mRNA interferase toxin